MLVGSPTLDPGNLVSENAAEVARGFVKGKSVDGCPKLQLISVAAAFVAVVASGVQIHRQGATRGGRGVVHRTRPVQLIAGALGGLEVQLREDALHGDLAAKAVKVDSRHDGSSLGARAILQFRGMHQGQRAWVSKAYGER